MTKPVFVGNLWAANCDTLFELAFFFSKIGAETMEPIEWESAMRGIARGQCTLANIRYDVEHNRLPSEDVEAFLEQVKQAWNELEESKRLDPLACFSKVLKSRELDSLCLGPSIPSSDRKCSRIVSTMDLISYNIDTTKLGWKLNGRLTDEDVSDLESLGLRGSAKGQMSTKRNFAWVTKTEELEQYLKDVAQASRASTARTLLGLLHFQEDEHLVEIRYPEAALHEEQLAAPTFIEGFPVLVYRSSCNLNDKWGRTVNLKTLEDGLPEAVHKAIDFTGDFKVFNLGRLDQFPYAFQWRDFLDTLPARWEA